MNNINIKHYSRNKSSGVVFAERFNPTIRVLLKSPVFEKCESHWIDILPTIMKQSNNRIHSSTKLAPIQARLKRIDGNVQKFTRQTKDNKFKVSSQRCC